MRLSGKPSRWVLAGLCLLSIVLMLLGERSRWLSRRARPVLVPLSHLGTQGVLHLRVRMDELTGPGARDEQARIGALEQDVRKKQEIIDDLNRGLAAMRKWESILRRPVRSPDRPNDPPTAYKCMLIDAGVIGSEPLPMRDRKLIGAGRRQGVAPGDLAVTRRLLHEYPKALPKGLTVLGRNYVVGQVLDSAGYSATLQLVTDPAFQAPGRILRLVKPGEKRTIYFSRGGADGAGGLEPRQFRHDGSTPAAQVVGKAIAVRADGDGSEIVCRNVSSHHDVRPGDVLTTARTAALPFRLTIGRVRGVRSETAEPHYVTVFVTPLANLSALREVYIVLPVDWRKN